MNSPKLPSRSLADIWREAADADVSLGERLAIYPHASSALRPDFAKAYDELVERLAGLDRGEVGPQVGERLEQFQLPDDHGWSRCHRVRRRCLLLSPDGGEVAASGVQLLGDFGIDLPAAQKRRRIFRRAGLDWTENRPHLAGLIGAAIAAMPRS